MNTLSLKFWILLISLIVIIITGSQQLLTIEPLTTKPNNTHASFVQLKEAKQPLKNKSPNSKTQASKTATQIAVKQAKPIAKNRFRPAPTIVRETYEPEPMEINLDENWDEEAYTAAYMEQQANMSKEELAAQETIFALDDQMLEFSEDFERDDAMYKQVKQYFHDMDEVSASKFRFLHLQCSNAICRLAVKVPDTNSQYELLDNRINDMDLFEQNYADIQINNDDSRIVILYLS